MFFNNIGNEFEVPFGGFINDFGNGPPANIEFEDPFGENLRVFRTFKPWKN